MQILAQIILTVLRLYMLLIFVWTFGSWFPQWRNQAWFRLVEDLVKPYVSLFRALPLRMGAIDFTPMAALMLLFVFEQLIISALAGGSR